MAFSVNKVILIGNLGQDPELAYSATGTAYCRFSIATSYSLKDKEKEGNWISYTDWHNAVAFGNIAERVSQNLKKGSKVYVEGRLKYDDYEKDGVKRKSTSIIVNDVVILDKKESADKGVPPPKEDIPEGNPDDDLPF